MSSKGWLAVTAVIALSTVACEFNDWRLARAGERLPLVGGSVLSPGRPWHRGPYGAMAPVLGASGWVSNLATGTYGDIVIAYNRVLNTNVGPIGTGMTGAGEPSGNEAIFVYSRLWNQPIPVDYFDVAMETAREDLIRLYKLRGFDVTDIEDVTSRYRSSLAFWPDHLFAMAYSAGGERYELVHAFTVVGGSDAHTNVVHDFSYVRMERIGEQDHFEDFIRMLKSFKTG